MSEQPAGFDQAVAVLGALRCGCGHRYNSHDPEDGECEAGSGLGVCPCRCFHSPDPNLTTNEYRLTALLAERVETPCPSGCGCVTSDDPNARECACDGPCCMDENWPYPSDVPLIVMGSELERIGWRSDAADAGPRWTIDAALVALDRNRGWYPVYRRVRARIEGEKPDG